MDETLETTPETQTSQRDAINQATLTPLVRRALNSTTAEVTSWGHEQLHGGLGTGTAVYRFSGKGSDQDHRIAWSLILKELCLKGGVVDAWAEIANRGEVATYRSGWLDNLPGSLAAPQCYGVTDHPDGTCWIWLEDITDDIGSPWPLEHYGVVARHLGQFNGAYLVERRMPSFPWLTSDGPRGFYAQLAPAMLMLRDSLDHPLVCRLLPDDAGERLLDIWEERDLYLDALDRLPQTLCHGDAFHRNLFARKTVTGDDQTVAVDWAYAGRRAIGAELVPLVQAGPGFFDIDLAQEQELEDIAFEGYLGGLRDAGWRGDPRQVRLGYTASSLHYFFGTTAQALPMILDVNLHGWFEQGFGRSIGEVLDLWAQAGRFIRSRIYEARELIEVLG
jgi:hypothetical protein